MRLDTELARNLKPTRATSYLLGAVTVASDRPSGVRRVEILRARIKASGAICIFSAILAAPPAHFDGRRGCEERGAGRHVGTHQQRVEQYHQDHVGGLDRVPAADLVRFDLGMNFHFMPEVSENCAYPVALWIIIVSGVLP
jgi:hypothetical protein